MQSADPFASLRRAPSVRSSSFAERLAEPQEHAGTPTVFPENPQKTAEEHQEHAEHRQSAREAWDSRTAELAAEMDLPREWAAAWAAIQMMPRPENAEEARWRQVVRDADAFCRGPAHSAIAEGWALSDIFGFDPEDGRTGLLLALRGGRAVILGGGVASIIRPDGSRDYFERADCAGLPPLWTIRKRTA